MIISCSNNFVEIPISEFNIDKNILEDGELVKIIYKSNMPDFNKDLTYYVNLIGVSQLTGDTVNILATSVSDITITDHTRNFISSENINFKIVQNMHSNFDNLNDTAN